MIGNNKSQFPIAGDSKWGKEVEFTSEADKMKRRFEFEKARMGRQQKKNRSEFEVVHYNICCTFS